MAYVHWIFLKCILLTSREKHNGIAAYAWKDHFLEHKQAIDDLVNKLKEQASTAATTWIKLEPQRSSNAPVDSQSISANAASRKCSDSLPPRAGSETKREKMHVKEKSEPDSRKEKIHTRESSEPRRPKLVKTSSQSHTGTSMKKVQESNGKRAKSNPKVVATQGSSRRTLNSLSSTPSQTLLASVPAGVPIDSHTGLPAAPSRSPSPPPADAGHKYTEQDAIFFFKRVAYDLHRDSDLTKAQLCDILGEKVCQPTLHVLHKRSDVL